MSSLRCSLGASPCHVSKNNQDDGNGRSQIRAISPKPGFFFVVAIVVGTGWAKASEKR